MLASLAHEADRNGYILLAPEWATSSAKAGSGRATITCTSPPYSATRFATSASTTTACSFSASRDGANMAMDVGMSHPDLFAGVLAMGPPPKWQSMFMEYWRNAQKLPFYIVTGELAGESVTSFGASSSEWMPKGFPGMLVLYKGRGIEWYPAEIPVMFDWMRPQETRRKESRFSRWELDARTGVGDYARSDNRFYWLGVDKITNSR